MNTEKQNVYLAYVKTKSGKSPLLFDTVRAFFVGGCICVCAELLFRLYLRFDLSENNARILTPVTVIFLASVLTGVGIFDRIAQFGGAGTLVPITGFANAVVSPAIDNRAEGYILGVGAKMFIVAGPVIVYGTVASVVWGIVYYFLQKGGIV